MLENQKVLLAILCALYFFIETPVLNRLAAFTEPKSDKFHDKQPVGEFPISKGAKTSLTDPSVFGANLFRSTKYGRLNALPPRQVKKRMKPVPLLRTSLGKGQGM